MGAGKLVLLLIAGGLGAGVLAAGMTTHAIRAHLQDGANGYPDDTRVAQSDEGYVSQPRLDSWIDRGLAVVEIPAWLARGEWGRGDRDDEAEWQGRHWHDRAMSDDQGYAPEEYSPPAYGYAPQELVPHANDRQNLAPSPTPDRGTSSALQSPNAPRNDSAADAAARAGAAAQDVMAAERGAT